MDIKEIFKNAAYDFPVSPFSEVKYSADDFYQFSEEDKKKYKDVLDSCKCCILETCHDHAAKRISSLLDVYQYMTSAEFSAVPKMGRRIVFSVNAMKRPKLGDLKEWSGMQVFDFDIKSEKYVETLKTELFNILKIYNWMFMVTKSSSGKSLHVYTHIIPKDIHGGTDIESMYKIAYVYKSIIIENAIKYIIESKQLEIPVSSAMLDAAMCKISQGVYISNDSRPLLNVNFKPEYFAYKCSESIIAATADHSLWKKLISENVSFDENADNILSQDDSCKLASYSIAENLKSKHFNYEQRWRISNTLYAIMPREKAEKTFYSICADTPLAELKGIFNASCSRPKKSIHRSILGELSACGINLKFDAAYPTVSAEANPIQATMKDIACNVSMFLPNQNNTKDFFLKSNEYLSDLKDLDFNGYKISLLVSPPGTGKTNFARDWFKKRNEKTIIVEPYTSTIKSKFAEDADYSYGFEKHPIDFSKPCVITTFDTFIRTPFDKFVNNGFQRVFIDESHLIFCSAYRATLYKIIENIQVSPLKFVLMTGTMTGEIAMFPDIHIFNVEKQDNLDRKIHVTICNCNHKKYGFFYAKRIAAYIAKGYKVIFPSNRGEILASKITGTVNGVLSDKYCKPAAESFYFKRDNKEDVEEQQIINKQLNTSNLLYCTNYLGVGVDINPKPKEKYVVIFTDVISGQDIIQFCNRLRNCDLHAELILPGLVNEQPKDYSKILPFEKCFNADWDEYLDITVKLLQKNYEQNKVIKKTNIQAAAFALSTNSIYYSEIDGCYKINEVARKLEMFNQAYELYATQVPVCLKYMQQCKWQIDIETYNDLLNVEEVEAADVEGKDAEGKAKEKKMDFSKKLLTEISDDNIDYFIDSSYRGNIAKGPDIKVVSDGIIVPDVNMMTKMMTPLSYMAKYYGITDIRKMFGQCEKTNSYNFSLLERYGYLINYKVKQAAGELADESIQLLNEIEGTFAGKTFTKEELDTAVNGLGNKYLFCGTGNIGIRKAKVITELINIIMEHTCKNKKYTYAKRILPEFTKSSTVTTDQYNITDIFNLLQATK